MKFSRVVLDNGLTVLHEKRDVPVTTVMLGTRFGSAYETANDKGLAHFIEHLCFKGTKKRSVREIAYPIEKVGGELNAFTDEEVTAYYAKLPSKHLRLAMDTIFDIFFNPVFPEKEVKKEAKVICEEIKRSRDNPSSYVIREIKGCLYQEPFGMFAAGTEETVKAMDREQLLKKHREIYVPENSILAVVGNNNLEQIVEMAKEFSVSREGIKPKVPKIDLQIKKQKEKRAGIQQANVAIGFHFPKISDKDRYASQVFSAILGEGMSSKLFTEVREQRGLAYAVRTDLDLGDNYGYLLIYIGTDKSKVDEVIKISIDEFRKMEELSEDELRDGKNQVIGNHYVGAEQSASVALNLIFEEVAGRASNYYDFEKKVRDVSLEDIARLAKKIEHSYFALTP